MTLIGTDAGRHLAGRLVNHFENYGFGHGFCFDVTKVIAVIPLTDAMGCGACPGNTVVISPSGWGSDLDTLYHEYLHNVGYDHKYDEQGNSIQPDEINFEAGRAAGYLCQFGEP